MHTTFAAETEFWWYEPEQAAVRPAIVKRLASLGPDFDDFVRASATPLMRTAVLLLGDRSAAEDLVQVALFRTATRWSAAQRAPTAYARRVLVNLAKDSWRNRSRRPITIRGSSPLPEATAAAGDEMLLLRDELLTALAQLPARQRAVLVLRYLEDLPVADVARIVGCAEGTVRSQSHHALAHMRALLPAAGSKAPVPEPTTDSTAPANHRKDRNAYR
jgi:RNA polymerase sigma-70 factor (sigma-E family)